MSNKLLFNINYTMIRKYESYRNINNYLIKNNFKIIIKNSIAEHTTKCYVAIQLPTLWQHFNNKIKLEVSKLGFSHAKI